LQAFSVGEEDHLKEQDDAAIPHLKKAVELDPNFAMAWATLGVTLSNVGRAEEGAQAVKKAYELRDRASEREKLYIQAHYYTEVTFDDEKALGVYTEWRQTYPRDTIPYDNAAIASAAMGQHEKALDFASQAQRIESHDFYAMDNIAGAYEALNRFDEAKSIAEQAEQQKSAGTGIHFILTDMAYMRGDHAAAEHELEAVKGTTNEVFLTFFNAAWQFSQGKVHASRELWQRSREMATSGGAKDFAAALWSLEAYDDALFGYQAEARQKASQTLDLSNDPEARTNAAAALAAADDAQKAASALAVAERAAPDNRYLQVMAFPLVRAWQQLQRNQLSEALSTLETLRPYELGTGPHGIGVAPIFLRGLVYFKMHDGPKAAAEFQRVLDHKGIASFGVEYPLSRLNLARAYALQGDTAKARTAYQNFFAAWKDADSDIPELKTAKTEYEKLK
jgi:tetratricopeptide (TPR) repeat protein